jgi:hypothetical protein
MAFLQSARGSGERVHLQQVLLKLLMNVIEGFACDANEPRGRPDTRSDVRE